MTQSHALASGLCIPQPGGSIHRATQHLHLIRRENGTGDAILVLHKYALLATGNVSDACRSICGKGQYTVIFMREQGSRDGVLVPHAPNFISGFYVPHSCRAIVGPCQQLPATSVRWLRPEYQKPATGVAAGFGEEFEAIAPTKAKEKKQEWPKTLPEQARALRQMLAAQTGVVTPEQLAKKFMRARVERVEELLQTLVSLGQAREVEAGRFAA